MLPSETNKLYVPAGWFIKFGFVPTVADVLLNQAYVKVGAPVTVTFVIEPVDALQLLGETLGVDDI